MVAPGDSITVGTTTFEVGALFAQGDVCELFECTYVEDANTTLPANATVYDRILLEDDGTEQEAVLKVVREPYNHELGLNEAKILGKIYPANQSEEKFYRLLPRLIASGEVNRRPFTITPKFTGYVSMAEVLQAYPNGIDFRDLVWMYKRALMGIGWAHQLGVVHGAILPPHILVHPVEHGARIVDWCYALDSLKGRITAAVPEWRDYYAPEVFNKQTSYPSTDIYMLTKCAIALLGGDVATGQLPGTVPEDLQLFFHALLFEDPRRRPQDAWELHEAFDKLIHQLVGKPTYRLFRMPAQEAL